MPGMNLSRKWLVHKIPDAVDENLEKNKDVKWLGYNTSLRHINNKWLLCIRHSTFRTIEAMKRTNSVCIVLFQFIFGKTQPKEHWISAGLMFTIRQLSWLVSLVVMQRDSRSKGRGFKSQHHILDGHFFTSIFCKNAKPQVSLTAPNRDYFEQVSLTVLDFFGCNSQSYKTNSWIYSTESQASFTDKDFFSFGNGI